MVQKTVTYQAADGQFFDTLAEAQEHELEMFIDSALYHCAKTLTKEQRRVAVKGLMECSVTLRERIIEHNADACDEIDVVPVGRKAA